MLKTLQWIYKLGYKRAEDKLLNEIYNLIDYHRYQEEIAYYRKDEPEDSVNPMYHLSPKLTSKEHGMVGKELYRLAQLITQSNIEEK